MSSYVIDWLQPFSERTLVMACVRVVFPWSTWPIVPMFTWGLERSNESAAKARRERERMRGALGRDFSVPHATREVATAAWAIIFLNKD